MMTPIHSKHQLIKEIAESLDCSSQSSNPYVDLTSQIVSEHIDSDWGEPELEEDLDGHELVELGSVDSHEAFEIMERFARSRDERECEKIINALSGYKPFRSFRVCVETLGILQEWYAFKGEEMIEMAKDLMESYGIDFVDGKIVCTKPDNVSTFVFDKRGSF